MNTGDIDTLGHLSAQLREYVVIFANWSSKFYLTDYSSTIAASIVSVSILMTGAILSQGSYDSIFTSGFTIRCRSKEECLAEAKKEAEIDADEEEIFSDNEDDDSKARKSSSSSSLVRSKSLGESGVDVFMKSFAPTLTVIMALVVLVSSYAIATKKIVV